MKKPYVYLSGPSELPIFGTPVSLVSLDCSSMRMYDATSMSAIQPLTACNGRVAISSDCMPARDLLTRTSWHVVSRSIDIIGDKYQGSRCLHGWQVGRDHMRRHGSKMEGSAAWIRSCGL